MRKTIMNTQNSIRDSETGFTILEIIVAISILSIGLLAVGTMQISAIRGNAFASGVTEGTSWGTDRMEKIIAMAYIDYDGTNLQDVDGDGDAGLSDATVAGADYSVTQGGYNLFWNIAQNSFLYDTKIVNLIVVWTEQGTQKSISFRTLIPKGI